MDPLTISDAASRYLLRCQVVSKTDTPHVLAVFETTFREFGLPVAVRTDNGAPFATRAIAGLSPLAVYWMKLGIIPERIAAGHPEQNGRHERMHRTLKAETAKPPAANPRAQQKVFDRFRTTYNQERPHEALEMKTTGGMLSSLNTELSGSNTTTGISRGHAGAQSGTLRNVRLEGREDFPQRNLAQ